MRFAAVNGTVTSPAKREIQVRALAARKGCSSTGRALTLPIQSVPGTRFGRAVKRTDTSWKRNVGSNPTPGFGRAGVGKPNHPISSVPSTLKF